MGKNQSGLNVINAGAKLVFGVIVVALLLLTLELVTGNGDGIWKDIPIVSTAFTIAAWIVAIAGGVELLKKSPSWVQNIGLFLAFGVGSVFFIDWAFGKIMPLMQKKQAPGSGLILAGPDYDSTHVYDADLGLRARPDMKFHWVKTHEGKPVQEAWITTDQYSRRIVPIQDTLGARRYHAIFFGCSFTFGDGLNDNETMPYYFEKLNPAYHAYNYGFFGYSTRHMLTWVQKFELEKQVPEKQGVGVYVYIGDHVNRNIPSAGWIGLYNGYFPDVNKDRLEADGVFRNNHPIQYRAGMWLFNSNIRRHFGIDFPLKYREKDYQFTADLIKKSSEEFKRQFKNSPFYVVLYPGLPDSDPIRTNLKARGIPFFDYSGLFPFPSKQYQQTHDGHPNATAQRLVMERLSRDLAVTRRDSSDTVGAVRR